MKSSKHQQQESYGNLSISEDSYSYSASGDLESFSVPKQLNSSSLKPTQNTVYTDNTETRLGTIMFLSPDDSVVSIDDKVEHIWDAIDRNDVDTVLLYILNQDISSLEDSEGFTPLHRSVIAGHLGMTQALIERVDVHAKDRLGRSALHYASMKNKEEIAKELIKHGASVIDFDELGKTPQDYCQNNPDLLEFFQHIEHSKEKSESTLKINGNLKTKQPYTNDVFSEGFRRKSIRVEIGNKKQRKLTGPVDETKKQSLMNDFKVLKVLSQSILGEVFLIQNQKSKEFHSMRVMNKEKIYSKNLTSMILIEKKILTTISSPFINPLLCSFQTHDKLIIVNHYCPRGSLFNLLQPMRPLSADLIKLYTSEIVLALECLHMKDFAFLNLKPSNILINNNGHIMLSDFTLAKEGINEEVGDSFKGSLNYIAPEIVEGCPYGIVADWYMLGLIVYEMATGTPYLYEDNKIEIKEEPLKNLIEGLLKNIPWNRLGFNTDSEEIKKHEFFNDINWENIKNLHVEMPLPDLLDTSNQIVDLTISDENITDKIPIMKSWTFYNNS